MDKKQYDFIIIGAGITGVMTARELSRYSGRVLVIEKCPDIGMGASSANSAILHAGYDPAPGSLKAEMNIRGNKLWDAAAAELDIACRRTGSYVVAIGDREFRSLDTLYQKGITNGVPGLQILSRQEFLTREPLINPQASGALFAPSAGVVDPFRAVVAAAENAVMNGAEILTETEFQAFIIEGGAVKGVKTSRGDFLCRWAVNAAGAFSDAVMHLAGVRPEFRITPRRGEYLVFDPSKIIINNVLFPLPSEKGKGTIVSTTTHGNVMIGPSADEADDAADTRTTAAGLNEIIANARRLVPSLDPRDVIAEFAGIRATGNFNRDFIVEIPASPGGLVNLGGIESPGLVSSPAIAARVVELLRENGEVLKERKDFNPVRKAPPCFHRLSHREKSELVRRNPAYGRIVCRCEEITEGEILEAIRSPVPARTYDAIKRRTWLGTGRCQGAFDYPRVIDIMAGELKVPVTEVTKKGRGSQIVFRGTKD